MAVAAADEVIETAGADEAAEASADLITDEPPLPVSTTAEKLAPEVEVDMAELEADVEEPAAGQVKSYRGVVLLTELETPKAGAALGSCTWNVSEWRHKNAILRKSGILTAVLRSSRVYQ